jgi:glycosyltransferase involved in cell wall biosynthesis
MISIIMPVKNAQPFLPECITSIQGQSYEDWQLIAVDDHSSDNSLNILETAAHTDNRIRVVNNPDHGIIPALQHGYAFAEGDYITRMDADDIMPQTKLELMLNKLQHSPGCQLVTGKVSYLNPSELNDGYKKYELWLNSQVDTKNQFDEVYKECVLPSCCWLISKAHFQQVDGFANLEYPEDYDLCFRFYGAGYKMAYIDDILHYWRDHPDRTSRTSPVYQDNSFLPLKVKWFALLNYGSEKSLVLWGAGKRGKRLAQLLIEQDIPFRWACNNPNKIGHNIYDQYLEDITTVFNEQQDQQIIIAVSEPEEQRLIAAQINQYPNIESFWFC